MFGKVKKWLGIEGVKVELIIPEQINASTGQLEGILRFYSMNSQTVKGIKVTLTERYTRGRKEEKLVDEYTLGSISLKKTIEVPAGESIEIPFQLPFEVSMSEMDEIGNKNFVFENLVKVGKWMNKVKSEFRVEAEATVSGVALNPFDKKLIDVV